MSDREREAGPRKVVVVGGGFAGRRVQRLLADESFDVTLVDAKGYFEYTPGALRCMVRPAHADATVLAQPKGTVVAAVVGLVFEQQGDSATRSVSGVRLSTGKTLPCDFAVLATGSAYAQPIKGDQLALTTPEARRVELARAAGCIAGAARVCVVGGGSVGVELAAEICATYGRGKRVTIISSQPRLLDRMAPACSQYAQKWLLANGAEVILGQRVTDWGGADAAASSAAGSWGQPGKYRIVTSGGDTVYADIVFSCIGARALPRPAREGLPVSPSGGGIQVLPTLQVVGVPNLYAVGDAADIKTEKTALAADLCATLAARNIRAAASGRAGDQRPFPQGVCNGAAFVPDIQAVSLGPRGGVAQFNAVVISGWAVAAMKWIIEHLQVGTAAGWHLHAAVWGILEWTNVLAGTMLFMTAAQRARA